MLEAALTLLVGVLITLAIIAACGFFVAQEFAYMSVDRSRMAARAEKGDAQAKRVLSITKRTSFMLSGAQLGITVTGLLIGYVAEPLIGESIGTLLGGVGIDPGASVLIGTIGALLLATIVTMIFGELYPKNLAIANPEPLARALAMPTRIYLLAFGWLITVFDVAANALLRLLRIEPLEDVDESATARDLKSIIEESRASGDLPDDLSMIIDRILDFPQRDAEHAMVPRSRVDSISPTTTIGEVRALMATGHTRYPVIGDEDDPVGVVELIDLLRTSAVDDAPVSTVMREAVVIPTTMLLPVALDRMRQTRNELACVVDEYGNFDGILTIEDLTEEVIGEISDEHDLDIHEVVNVGDDHWTLPGDVHLDEVERLIGHDLPRGDAETIAGLIISEHGDLVPTGVTVRIALPERASETIQGMHIDRWLDVEVTEVERHVPSELILRLRELDRDAEHEDVRTEPSAGSADEGVTR
ncbi:hemolysin family protein [Microbacterium sp. RU33B]|uniref:hemolysin family protein n=1 Tax=Microbacterium sp. RU33B TaxID=1907390 RepID=UPI000959E13E|nr:hemolysin family protein [Microbacterium sp. RU33B]SIT69435.1 Hemolysin, contains CBS domains [Microbacterium sp. RU33B]